MATANMYAPSERLTLKQLEQIKTPTGSNSWTPVPHVEIPRAINAEVADRGWEFVESPQKRFDIYVTPNEAKMFGLTKLRIPGLNGQTDFDFAIGFRNSHNKTMALRFAVGTCVIVCENMMLTGEFCARREHTSKISCEATVNQALERVPEMAQNLQKDFMALQGVEIGEDRGIAFLAQAVEDGCLPLTDFLGARAHYRLARETGFVDPDTLLAHNQKANETEQVRILHADRIWGVYQAVTDSWRGRSTFRLPHYSEVLNATTKEFFNLDLPSLN